MNQKLLEQCITQALNKVVNSVEGDRGVYAFMVTSKDVATALPNYDTNRKRISEARKRLTFKMYEAIKNSSNVRR